MGRRVAPLRGHHPRQTTMVYSLITAGKNGENKCLQMDGAISAREIQTHIDKPDIFGKILRPMEASPCPEAFQGQPYIQRSWGNPSDKSEMNVIYGSRDGERVQKVKKWLGGLA